MAWNNKPLPDNLWAGKIKLYPVYGYDFKQAKELCKKHKLYNRTYSYSKGGEAMKRLYTEKHDLRDFVNTLDRQQENPILGEIEAINALNKQIDEIEKRIEIKIQPKLTELLEKNDFEGAKKFVGGCFRPLIQSPSAQAVLMFRKIIIKENEFNNNEKNTETI